MRRIIIVITTRRHDNMVWPCGRAARLAALDPSRRGGGGRGDGGRIWPDSRGAWGVGRAGRCARGARWGRERATRTLAWRPRNPIDPGGWSAAWVGAPRRVAGGGRRRIASARRFAALAARRHPHDTTAARPGRTP